jgi:hypothetical protein
MYFPYGGILGQGAEAKGCDINATIGMAFEEDGSPLVMDSFKKGINLDKKAFLYAGSFGIPELRAKWREMQIEKNPSLKGKEFSNPVVTNALTHGLRISAELFAESEIFTVCECRQLAFVKAELSVGIEKLFVDVNRHYIRKEHVMRAELDDVCHLTFE